MSTNTRAELSSISTQVEEILNRVVKIADEYRFDPDSAFVNECNNAERNLMSAIRALDRATKQI